MQYVGSALRRPGENAFEPGHSFLTFGDLATRTPESRHPALESCSFLVEPGGLSLVMSFPSDVGVIHPRSGPQQAAAGSGHGRSSMVWGGQPSDGTRL